MKFIGKSTQINEFEFCLGLHGLDMPEAKYSCHIMSEGILRVSRKQVREIPRG